MTLRTGLGAVLLATTALLSPMALADTPQPAPAPSSLEEQFRDPPNSARPRVWWHWMNGNVTKDGIAKDMAWMKSVGIGGLQNFDANLMTPQIVKERLVYMTPAWKDAFHFAASEAERLGLELAIASSPGWSETGGPWVPPEDGLKKVVWSEARIAPGKRLFGALAGPPTVTGPYGALPMNVDVAAGLTGNKPKAPPQAHGDIAVFAMPVAVADTEAPRIALSDGTAVEAGKLSGADFSGGISVPRGTDEAPTAIVFTYAQPRTIRSARLFIEGAKTMFTGATVAPVLEASDDGKAWRKVADLPLAEIPATASFAPATARQFRVVLRQLHGKPMLNSLGSPAPGLAMSFDIESMMGAAKTWRLRHLSLSDESRVDSAEVKAGFATTLDYFALPQVADGAAGPAPAQVLDITGHLKADGTLDWVAPRLPKGQEWRVIRLGWSLLGTTNHPAPAEATGLEVDKFDGAAVRRYMDHYLAMYRDAAGPGMLGAHGVRAILTDSIEVGSANWTPRMVEQFKRLRGYDPTPFLPVLTGALVGSREQSDRFLYDYRRTLADLMASEHYGTVAKVAHEAGLTVYGEALEDHRPSLGDDMAMRSHTDIPMSAMWTHSREQGPKASYLADTKGAASVAHIYGQNLVAAESMTSAMSPWNDSPRTLKRIIDLEFLQGINRPVIHTSVHQPTDDKLPGLSLFIFGQYFNRHESWAPLARPWVDYIARNALLLQQGHDAAELGYFYGEEAPLTGLYGDKPVADAPRTHAYDFVNADALMGALSNDGGDLVTPGGARYKALYLGGSSRKMTLAALEKIAVLVEGGATIVGEKPEGSPSNQDDPARYAALVARLWPGGEAVQVGKGRVIASHDIERALAGVGVGPDFAFTGGQPGAEIPFVHRRLADGDSYFLVNRKDRPETIEAHFRVTGKVPELWHAETGKSEAISYRIANGETVMPLSLNAEDAVHVVFRKPATADALAIKKLAPTPVATLEGAWSVAFEPGRGAPASAVLPTLKPLDQNADPAIKYFSGVATYTNDFAAPKGWKAGQPLWLDLGEAREVAEVWLNGKPVGAAWHAPYRLDVSAAARAGRNHLEIKVADLWVNRLIGDAQPGVKQKITWTALPTYRADAALRPSGLIGPVTLLGQSR